MPDRVVENCVAAGLVGGEGFAVDASLIVADANEQRSVPGSQWSKVRDHQGASHAVREYLATLDNAAFGGASAMAPKFVSPSDPAAQWTALYIPLGIERRCEAALSILSFLLRCLGTSLDSFARHGGAFLRSSFALLHIPSYCPPTERAPNARSANTLARRIAVNIAKLPDLLRQ